MKLLAVVVAYHPDVNDFVRNVNSYVNDVDLLLIWNNSPKDSDLSSLFGDKSKVRVMDEGRNCGLPYAYNRAIEVAEREGYTHVMTMDQDSCFSCFSEYRQQMEALGTDDMTTLPMEYETPISCITEVPHCAQSACVHSMNMIRKVGPFREDFFIGMVDVEMQLRAKENGYKIYKLPVSPMEHHIGSGRTESVAGKVVHLGDYGPLRHYYDSRNRILMWREFPYDYNFKGKARHLFGRFKVCVKILVFEKNKWAKISAIVRGTWNGLFNRIVPF